VLLTDLINNIKTQQDASIETSEPPYYAVFSNLLSLHLSLDQIISSTPFSQTPSVYIPPFMSKTKFHNHTEPQAKL
jgi:hypothetical protein